MQRLKVCTASGKVEKGKTMQTGKALKVSIYINEGSTHHGFTTASTILDYLFYRGVSGATVLKGVAGFGAGHHMHTASTVEISDRLPVKIEFIETPGKVDELMGKLEELSGSGMIEIQETMVVKAGSRNEAPPELLPRRKLESKAKLLRIYVNEEDRWHDKPLHEALVEALRANEMAGVTVYKSILAYGSVGEIHRKKIFGDGASLMLSTIDTEERIRAFMPVLEKMMADGLVVLSDVDIVTYRYGSEDPRHTEGSNG
jgi:PII-like signaling protein